MTVTEISVEYCYKINLGNYETLDIGASVKATIDEREPASEAFDMLWEYVQDEVRERAREVKKKKGLPADDADNGRETENAAERDPRPKTLADLVTPKQLWMIRNLGRELGCDVEQECQSLLKCNLEEISKRAASSFIDHLKKPQSEYGEGQA